MRFVGEKVEGKIKIKGGYWAVWDGADASGEPLLWCRSQSMAERVTALLEDAPDDPALTQQLKVALEEAFESLHKSEERIEKMLRVEEVLRVKLGRIRKVLYE